jgi:hypothetical protein
VSPSPLELPEIAALLRDLGPQLRRGSQTGCRETAERLPTGLPDIDRLVGGGFPPGRLSEIAGPPSSGRTSVAFGLLARATRAGEVTAIVDTSDAFDPTSAQAAGVVLERVLWVRAPGSREATRCAERLLEAHGFALVVLDLAFEQLSGAAPATATWQRLARAAAATGTALVVLGLERWTGTFADLALEMQPTRAHFTGTPSLLESLEIEARVVRHRTGVVRRAASVRLRADSRAA